jgi:hypothetical protein
MLLECKCNGVTYINPKQVTMVNISVSLGEESQLHLWFTGDEDPIVFTNAHDEIVKYAQKLDRCFNEGH